MASDSYRCPRCPALLGRTPGSPPGSPVRCPGCKHVFRVPPEDAVLTEPPLLLPEPEGRVRPRRPPRGPRAVQLTNAFTPDIHLYCRMAAGAWADYLWGYIGFTGACGAAMGPIVWFGLVTAPVLFGLPLLILIPLSLALAQLTATLPLGPAIKAVLGREYELIDFIYGMDRIVPILLYAAVNATFFALAYGPPAALLAYAAYQAGGPQPLFARMNVALAAGLIGYAVLAVPLAWMLLFTRFSFALCLVFDRRMGFFEAMAVSWRMTKGHFGPLFLILLMQAGLVIAGVIPCGLATGFTLPYAFLLRAASYVHATTPPGVVAYAAAGPEPDEDDYPSLGL